MFYPPPTTPTHWNVFAPDGRLLSEVTLPARFTPFEVGADYVLGVSRDNDDMERATLLRLRR
jgi:glutamate mutase epsilon subunit